MTDTLARPLTQKQLEAAKRLHGHLTQWVTSDNALAAMAQAFPQWDVESSLLKVAAINQLYGTNLYAVARMATHVTNIIQTADLATEGVQLVERLARLPQIEGQTKQWRHYSFASKLAHFFIDSDQFHIYDSYVVTMLKYHLGRKGYRRDNGQPYITFVANLARLCDLSGVAAQGRDLDHYLWIAGEYHAWRKDHNAPINREVLALFQEAPTSDVAADLAALAGDSL